MQFSAGHIHWHYNVASWSQLSECHHVGKFASFYIGLSCTLLNMKLPWVLFRCLSRASMCVCAEGVGAYIRVQKEVKIITGVHIYNCCNLNARHALLANFDYSKDMPCHQWNSSKLAATHAPSSATAAQVHKYTCEDRRVQCQEGLKMLLWLTLSASGLCT